MGHGHHFRSRGDLRFDIFLGKISVGFQVNIVQLRPRGLRGLLPGDEIAVMFGDGEKDLVAGAKFRPPVAVRDEIQGLGGVFREDDLFRFRGVDEAADPFPGVFVDVRGLYGEGVGPPVGVGVAAAVITAHGLDHAFRFLRGGAVVQIDDRAAVHRLIQQGKIAAKFLGITHGKVSLQWRCGFLRPTPRLAGERVPGRGPLPPPIFWLPRRRDHGS